MKLSTSSLFELQADPYDYKQRHFFRVCIFRDVTNAGELRNALRTGEIDYALIKPELVLETFVLLAAANRSIHQAAHNRMATRSLHAELIYSLSPNRNISSSLTTFGIGETSTDVLVAIFDDQKGDKMIEASKRIKGRPVSLNELPKITNYDLIKKIYHVAESEYNDETITDAVVTRIITKDFTS
ncbi:hypothetical protein AB6A40_002645 [Gnathostoma spinigerum]|uniref:TP53RK-binding protein n=1 Tax=Gnathostoma spinigerum TaxID=75299 RepID=A0ABD6E8J2_9BILA